MVDSTPSRHIGDKGAARTPELVVEGDAGREAEQPRRDAHAQVRERARTVALEGEDVLAGPARTANPLRYGRPTSPWKLETHRGRAYKLNHGRSVWKAAARRRSRRRVSPEQPKLKRRLPGTFPKSLRTLYD